MDDVYKVKVKTKDATNLYPSERRYSATTVSGIAWIHITLAIILLILVITFVIQENMDRNVNSTDYNNLLVLAPSVVSIFAMTAGAAAILSSVKWYVDKNIVLLLIASIISFLTCLTAICMLIFTCNFTNVDSDVLVLKHNDVLDKNNTHFVINRVGNIKEQKFIDNVVLVNILIAMSLEMFWSILSMKISYDGMKNTYEKRDCIRVVTVIERGRKLNTKMNRVFLAHNTNGFYLKNETAQTENCKEGMDSLNASFECVESNEPVTPSKTPISWGDSPDHSIYNQNTLDFDRIYRLNDNV